MVIQITIMRGSRGGRGSGGPDPPPRKFAKLNIANITGNEKISFFHIWDFFFSYLRLGPPPTPLEKFSGSAPVNDDITAVTVGEIIVTLSTMPALSA